jgi:hypothetical protein
MTTKEKTTMLRKALTIEEAKRYMFAGSYASITLFNNKSLHILKYTITRSSVFKEFMIRTDHDHENRVLGKVKSDYPWELHPTMLSSYSSEDIELRVFLWLIRMLAGLEAERDDVDIIINSNRCAGCGRTLSDSKSLTLGFGPTCWKETLKEEKEKRKKEDEERRDHYFGSCLYHGD